MNEEIVFNRIQEMNTEAERRRIAAMAMQGILSNEISQKVAINEREDGYMPECVAEYAVDCADALIAELNKRNDGRHD